MLETCTKGFYKATTHRVVNPKGEEMLHSRYSNAFFLNPRDEVKLDKNHTAFDFLEEHIRKKLEHEKPNLSDT
jgi:isopenicillin N synthase-like dioxygenase